jgi:hypothetical protein
VSIAPKVRRATPGSNRPDTISPAKQHANKTQGQGPVRPKPSLQLLRVFPVRLLPSLTTSSSSTQTQQKTLAYLSPLTFAQITGLSPSLAVSRGGKDTDSVPRASQTFYRCNILRISPPVDPVSASAMSPHSGQGGEGDAKIRKAEATGRGVGGVEVYVGWDAGIPSQHIVPVFLTESNIAEWDVVRSVAHFSFDHSVGSMSLSLFRITLLTGEEADTIIETEGDADQENYQAGGALHTLVNGDRSDK